MICMSEIIKIDRYDVEIDPHDGRRTIVYAIAGKKKFRMPDAFREMYTNEYLAIQEQTPERPELFEETGPYYIPRRTSA